MLRAKGTLAELLLTPHQGVHKIMLHVQWQGLDTKEAKTTSSKFSKHICTFGSLAATRALFEVQKLPLPQTH
eukprot:149092-Amphidinium_carterae.1